MSLHSLLGCWLAARVNAVPMIQRCGVRQWEALTEDERREVAECTNAGVPTISHRPFLWLWWVEVGARHEADYRLLPLMTVKTG